MDSILEAGLGDAVGVTGRVARLVAAQGRISDPAVVRSNARRLLALESPLAPEDSVELVVDRVTGLGPLRALLSDDDVTDVLINGPHEVWVERRGNLERTDVGFDDEADLLATIDRLISRHGLRIDRSSPMVDARLPDGSRFHAAIPPAAVDHPVVAIRRFNRMIRTFDQLTDSGCATEGQVEFLTGAIQTRNTIVVSGGTGAGKTTLLNLLAELIPTEERLVTVEDAAELRFTGHVVRLEARPPNAEGVGAITIRQLLRSALRLRPDRIILGEVRGPEALDLLTALNTGHEGSLSTIHANSPQEAMWRLETLALIDGAASPAAVTRQLYSAIDLVVQMARLEGHRQITSISSVQLDHSVSEVDLD